MLFVGIGTYKGNFVAGNLEGKGRFDYQDGSYYEGEFKEDRKQGKGIFVEADGATVYNGGWFNDLKHGKGTIIQGGTYKIEGIWKDGILQEMLTF